MVEKTFSVSQLAQELGITPRALRFYEDKGLISPRRSANSRVYTVRDRGRMILVMRGKQLGFTLREIKEYLELYDVGSGQVEQLRLLVTGVGARIARLEAQRRALDQTLAELREVMRQASAALAEKGLAGAGEEQAQLPGEDRSG